MSFLSLLSTVAYNQDGTAAPNGYIHTVSSSKPLFLSTIVGSGITMSSLSLTTSSIALGRSTTQSQTNFSNGSYLAGAWQTAKSSMTGVKKLGTSSTGQYQLIVSDATNNLFLSSDSGITWSALGAAQGLPTLTGSAVWASGAISASGQYILLAVDRGSLWMSQDFGRTFATSAQPTPNIWLQLNGDTTDTMGGAAATAFGSPAYVTVQQPGFSEQAIHLFNTAGGTASQYVRGSWAGANNFTVSMWVNLQTVNGSNQQIFTAYNGYIALFINGSNNLCFFLPTGSGTSATTIASTFAAVANTWYYLSATFQANGVCSFYVNNTLIGSYTNSGGFGTITSSGLYALGTFDAGLANPLNGYITDFRLTNSVSTYIPVPHLAPNIWLPLDGSTADLGSNGITPTVTGTVGYVTGVVGSQAVNIFNTTAGGTAQNYIRGAWTGALNWTVSFWFNAQTLSSGTSPVIWSSYSDGFTIYIENGTNRITYVFSSNNSNTNKVNLFGPSATTNTWYHVYATFQTNGTGSFYINGNLIGSGTNTGGIFSGWTNTGQFGLGTFDFQATNAFNGYIDDFRLYNSAIPFSTTSILLPQNYRSLALSGSGQYALASAATSGWVVGSSNSLASWTKQAVCVGAQNPASLSLNHSGQYQVVATGPASGSVMPNKSGNTTNSWSQGGVNWVASSSPNPALAAYFAFNNNSLTGNNWIGTLPGTYSATGTYTGSVTTAIQTIGSIGGEWVQLQASVPLVLTSYTYGVGSFQAQPKTMYIVGSMDGSTWYPLQLHVLATNPFTTNFTIASTYIIMNRTGTQTVTAQTSAVLTTTAYSYTTQPFLYFRFIVNTNFWTVIDAAQFGELYLNFQNSVSYSSNYGVSWANTANTVSNEIVSLSPSGQYALSTNSVTPLARLTLDNTAVDAQGALTPTTGAGTVTYSSSIVKVGTHSAFFNNTAGAAPSVYLNYTVPAVLNTPPMLTMACWVYPTVYGDTCPICLGNTASAVYGPNFNVTNVSTPGAINFNVWNTSSTQHTILSSGGAVPLNTWTHLVGTVGGGSMALYINGVLINSISFTGLVAIQNGGAINNLFVGTAFASAGAFAGYVDDVRIYTSALNADEVNALYNNPTLTQTIAVSSSYLPITSYREPILPNINAPVVDAKVSQTGQYMVAVTSGTTNNVYYSTDFGSTFTALTLGTTAMTSCAISYDGSYFTATNATTTYTLNRNSTGFTVALGNAAGQVNQASNAIAIGNLAGQTNQSANSIVLNASGSAVNASASGLYAAPVQPATASASTAVALLGYGDDKQIVQTTASANPATGQLTLAGPLYAPDDAIARGAYLTPSAENATAIQAWVRKMTTTVAPTGISPFWGNSQLYSTVAGAPGGGAYIGGVLVPDGRVVFVPSVATTIGLFNPSTNTYSTIAAGGLYSGGVLLPDGRVVFVPAGATTIGMFNPTTNTYTTPVSGLPGGGAYQSGVLLPDGRVLFVPHNATTIGFFNPTTNTYSTLAGAPGSAAYLGGVLLPDGRVVFVPCNSGNIGIFNSVTNTFSTISVPTPSVAYQGGVLLPDGRVLFVPRQSSSIGLFNPSTNTYSTIPMSPAPGTDGYIGGMLLPDGRVLFVPYNATTFGLFNPTTNTYSTISGAPGSSAYSGGVLLPDGRVVFVPYSATTVGLFHQPIPASREMCLHPMFNRF